MIEQGQDVYFDDFEIGQKFITESYSVEKEEVISFAKKWDPQPFHIDEAAAKASMFGGLTACSAHIFSMFCAIAPKWKLKANLQVMAGLGFDGMKMLHPIYVGDVLTCIVNVSELHASKSKKDRGVVTNFCQLINQDEKVVFEVYSKAMVRRKA